MKQKNQPINELYQNLGYLFYAVAAADKVVRPEEIKALKQIMKSTWLPFNAASLQIEVVFDRLVKENPNAQDCLKNFKAYKEKHGYLFSAKIKILIRKTAFVISNAVARNNKSELVLLSQLDMILKA